MIYVDTKEISVISIGSGSSAITPNQIDVGNTKVWPDSSTGPGPGPGHTYSFYIQNYSTDNIGYTGGTLIIYITSTCDGVAEEVSYTVVENGSTPNWISLLQRQSATGQPYNWVYYFAISSNSGSLRHAGFTFTQNGSGNTATLSITQHAYTTAFNGLTILARRNEWIIGSVITSFATINGTTYPNRGILIAKDSPITSQVTATYSLTVSRPKNVSTPSLGNDSITLTGLRMQVPSGSMLTFTKVYDANQQEIGSNKTYYGAYLILTDTSFITTNNVGSWQSTPGTHTTLTPYLGQQASSVTLTSVL